MAFLKWSSEFETTIPKIDEQHQKLVKMMNDLFDAMNSGKSKDVLGTILYELIKYTKMHFKTEEDMMVQTNYSGYTAHLEEHNKFAQTVLDFNNQFNEGNARITVQLMNFLKDWLTNHILGTDKLYTEAFKTIK